jgi:hypothetical protein
MASANKKQPSTMGAFVKEHPFSVTVGKYTV